MNKHLIALCMGLYGTTSAMAGYDDPITPPYQEMEEKRVGWHSMDHGIPVTNGHAIVYVGGTIMSDHLAILEYKSYDNPTPNILFANPDLELCPRVGNSHKVSKKQYITMDVNFKPVDMYYDCAERGELLRAVSAEDELFIQQQFADPNNYYVVLRHKVTQSYMEVPTLNFSKFYDIMLDEQLAL